SLTTSWFLTNWNAICRGSRWRGHQWLSFPEQMAIHTEKASAVQANPQTLSELQGWIRDTLHLSPDASAALLAAIDGVFTRHERLWQESKHEAIQALSAGFTDKMEKVKTELSARDATVSSISRY